MHSWNMPIWKIMCNCKFINIIDIQTKILFTYSKNFSLPACF